MCSVLCPQVNKVGKGLERSQSSPRESGAQGEDSEVEWPRLTHGFSMGLTWTPVQSRPLSLPSASVTSGDRHVPGETVKSAKEHPDPRRTVRTGRTCLRAVLSHHPVAFHGHGSPMGLRITPQIPYRSASGTDTGFRVKLSCYCRARDSNSAVSCARREPRRRQHAEPLPAGPCPPSGIMVTEYSESEL